MKIIFTEDAEENIKKIWEFNCLFNKLFAQRIQKSIYKDIRTLSKYPKSGHIEELLKNKPDEYRSLVVAGGRYKVIYAEKVNYIVIHVVFDCRSNPDKIEA